MSQKIQIPHSVKTIAVICNQWGDTGKGKLIDYLLDNWASVSIRFSGADNCGHTVVVNGHKYVTHMLPSSIINDSYGKISVIARGVAFSPLSARNEFDNFAAQGITRKNLIISRDAKLIMPWDIALDMLREQHYSGKIGSTGRGVGPVFSHHIARYGVKVGDMLNPEIFREKLIRILDYISPLLSNFSREDKIAVFNNDRLDNGLFINHDGTINLEAILNRYSDHGEYFSQNIGDAEGFIRARLGKENMVLEGAQGALLDIDYGTYPFVSSSNVTTLESFKACGIHPHEIDVIYGTVKAPYMTRVGEGPFPTEIGGYNTVYKYQEKYKDSDIPLTEQINSDDQILQAGAIGVIGNEFGATTKRPRRVGWLDLPALKYALSLNGDMAKHYLVITKPDVLTGCKEIKICYAYEYNGPDYYLGRGQSIKKGERIDFTPKSEILKHCTPIYRIFPGWTEDISQCKQHNDLPFELVQILIFITNECKTKIGMISVGPDRNQTIFYQI